MSVYVEKNQGGWCRGRRELAGIPREKWKGEGVVELGDRRGSGSFVGRTERSCSPGWAPSRHVAESQCKQQALILAGREAGGARHTQSLPPRGSQDILHIKSLDRGPSQMAHSPVLRGGGMLSLASPWLLSPRIPPSSVSCGAASGTCDPDSPCAVPS